MFNPNNVLQCTKIKAHTMNVYFANHKTMNSSLPNVSCGTSTSCKERYSTYAVRGKLAVDGPDHGQENTATFVSSLTFSSLSVIS